MNEKIIPPLLAILFISVTASLLMSNTGENHNPKDVVETVSEDDAYEYFDKVYKDSILARPMDCSALEPIPVTHRGKDNVQHNHGIEDEYKISFHNYLYEKEKDVNRMQLCTDDVEELRVLMCQESQSVVISAANKNLSSKADDRIISGFSVPEFVSYFCKEEMTNAISIYKGSFSAIGKPKGLGIDKTLD